jgi:hypothetical protein
MGAIYFSINKTLADVIARELSIKHFVETGTYNGDTIESVKDIFDTIDSVELSEELFKKASSRFEACAHIHCHFGDSAQLLTKITNKYNQDPILYWLDAHWCAGENTAGEESQCPLLNEIQSLSMIHDDSVIWIDDARYFIAPPPAPLVTKGWPSFQNVLDVLNATHCGSHELFVADDTLLLVPKRAGDMIREYLHEYGHDLLKIAYDHRAFKAMQTLHSERRVSLLSRVNQFIKKF